LTWLDIEDELSELFIVMDLSFISLLKIFPVIKKLKLEKKNVLIECISLIKPQFEVEQNQLVKGIVTNPLNHFAVLKKILRFLKNEMQSEIIGICNSAIKGNSGNKEFFVYWKLN
jgi:23S rRNA (cytidine1920-2'-O)/16S rRNA (cytidine1409-2'-O)-methyltransferase